MSEGRSLATSLSMGRFVGQSTDYASGPLKQTGGTYDFAIQGEGFFKVSTPAGERLTRAGSYTTDLEGVIVDPAGNPLLDEGGGEITIPPDAVSVGVGQDGTLSVDGEIFAKIGVYTPLGEPERVGDNLWRVPDGDAVFEEGRVLQGFIEGSNVQPVAEFAKLMLAQRMYEAGQKMADQEHERLSTLIDAMRQQG